MNNKLLAVAVVVALVWYQQKQSAPKINPATDPLRLIGTGRGL